MRTPPSPDLPPPPHSRRRLGFMLGVLFIAWMVFTQILPRMTAPPAPVSTATPLPAEALQPPQSAPPPAAAPALLAPPASDARLEALEQKVAQLSSAQASQPELAQRISQLEQEVAAAQASLGQLQQLREKAQLQAARLSAYGSVSEAIATGEPYRAVLDTLRSASAQDAELSAVLDRLQPHADAGIPRLLTLQQRFDEASAEALQPQSSKDAPWYRKVESGFSHLVIIRKTGTPPGQDTAAILARAQAALDEGRLGAALKQLDALTLTPSSAEALSAWRAQAAVRLDAEAALRQLRTLAIAP